MRLKLFPHLRLRHAQLCPQTAAPTPRPLGLVAKACLCTAMQRCSFEAPLSQSSCRFAGARQRIVTLSNLASRPSALSPGRIEGARGHVARLCHPSAWLPAPLPCRHGPRLGERTALACSSRARRRFRDDRSQLLEAVQQPHAARVGSPDQLPGISHGHLRADLLRPEEALSRQVGHRQHDRVLAAMRRGEMREGAQRTAARPLPQGC